MVPNVQYKKQCYMVPHVQYKKVVLWIRIRLDQELFVPHVIRVRNDGTGSRFEFSDEKICILEECVEVFYCGASKTRNPSL
jgi:hypothetical protein